MKAFPVIAVLGAIVAPALGVPTARGHGPGLPPQGDEFRWTGRLAAGKTIEVKGVNGDVRAQPASGAVVEVLAVKREGRRGSADDVTFEVIEHEGGVTICAMYPDVEDERPNECAPGDGGRMNVRRHDTTVRFTVSVPAGVGFVGRTVNGDVDTEQLAGDVGGYTVNGSVTVLGAGHAEARTVNGSIRAAMGRADWTGDAEFVTVNGNITLELPSGLNADIRAQTVNGGFESDYPVTIEGRFGPRRVRGRVGSGGRTLSLETVNGSIRLIERG
jgi:DUF4097 and DUF4098 domain-containing protein YvlB